MQKRERSAKNSFLIFKQLGIELNNNKDNTPLNNTHTFFSLRKRIPLSSKIYKSKSASLFEVNKKIKKMALSNKAYFNYMDKYAKLTQNFSFKTPNLSFYPKKKDENYLPIFYLKKKSSKNNSNDNSKTNNNIFLRNTKYSNYTNLNNINLFKAKESNKNDDNKNNDNNEDNNVIKEKPYGFKYKNTRIVYDKKKITPKSNLFKYSNSSINITNLPNKHFSNKNKINKNIYTNKKEKAKNKIFKYFYEGDFLERPKSQLSSVDIKSKKDKSPNIIIKDYDINNSLEDLYEMIKNIKNMTDLSVNKTMKYDIKNYYQNEDFSFQVDIESICLKFINQKENKNKENNDDDIIDKPQRIYLPFAYLPIFYLLDYTTFKIFLSEIIYYNRHTNSMEINKNEIGSILNKYKKFITVNVINPHLNKKRILENITYNCKEHHYQNIFDWIIYINELSEANIKKIYETDKKMDNFDKKNIIYKVKIIFPIVKFHVINRRLKIKKYLNKNLVIKMIKNGFAKWEESILCELFMNKKFRNIINNSLAPNNRIFIFSYLTKKIFIDRTGNRDNILSKKKYEFFITNAHKDFSHYLYIAPYTVYVLYGKQDEKKIYSNINLNIKDSINLNKYSQYWGYINTLNKCMKVEYMKQLIDFDLNILEKNPQKFFYLNKIDKNRKNKENKENAKDLENYGILKFKNNYDIEMCLVNCSIAEMQINQYKIDKRFYKVPKSLLNVFLSEDMKHSLELNKYISEYSELILFNDDILNLRKEEIDLKRKAYKVDGTIKLDEDFSSEKHKTIFSSFKNINKLNSFRINPSSRYSNNPSINKGLGGLHFFLSASFKRSDSNSQFIGSFGKSLKNLDEFYKKEKILRKKEKKYTTFNKSRDRKLSKTNVSDFSERSVNKTNTQIIQVNVKENENALGKDE